MQDEKFEENIEKLKKQVDNVLANINILNNTKVKNFLRSLEEIRYEIFKCIEIRNKYSQNQDINFVNKNYKVEEIQGILKIFIPEVLPKYKNISNPAYKNILLNVSNAVKEYKDFFGNKLTFVMILVHEKQINMDIDNKYVKPIIDALVIAKVIKDDNFTNMFYSVLGKNDTTKPYTEVYVIDGEYFLDWIKIMQDMF